MTNFKIPLEMQHVKNLEKDLDEDVTHSHHPTRRPQPPVSLKYRAIKILTTTAAMLPNIME